MTNYVEKIKNLLEMAGRETTNEHEARTALLKAHKLMAKYKISEKEIINEKDQEVIRKLTGIDYSLRRDPWLSHLAKTVANHHCCQSFQCREKGKQIAEIGFIGFTDDVSICMEVFKYAVDCVQSKTKELRKTKGVDAANGYGFGFVGGLYEAYNKQQEEEGWGIVLVVPEAVNEAMKNIKTRKSQAETKLKRIDVRTYIKGVKDGHKFHEQKRITSE